VFPSAHSINQAPEPPERTENRDISLCSVRLQINLQQIPQLLQPLRRHPIHQISQQILLPRLTEDHAVHRQRSLKILVALFVLAEGNGWDVAFDAYAVFGIEDPEGGRFKVAPGSRLAASVADDVVGGPAFRKLDVEFWQQWCNGKRGTHLVRI